MSTHIEHPAAYAAARERRIKRNAKVGRIQRLADEHPELLRLIEVDNEAHERWATRQGFELAHPYWRVDEPGVMAHDAERIIERDDAPFARSLIAQYVVFGRLSDTQWDWVRKLPGKMRERWAEREREHEARAKASDHVGSIGERAEFDVTVEFCRSIEGGQWGPKRLIKFITPDGNVLTWFATANWAWDLRAEMTGRIRATVKDHDNYRGVPQTIVNRVHRVSGLEDTA